MSLIRAGKNLRYSIDLDTGTIFGRGGKPICKKEKHGYITLCPMGAGGILGHRFIWEAVHGPIPCGLQINHINGVKDDNRIANLELVTPLENIRHAWRTGLASVRAGEDAPASKLKKEEVLAIRDSVIPRKDLAHFYGVSVSTIGYIQTRARWGHL